MSNSVPIGNRQSLAARQLRRQSRLRPRLGIVLGSGFQAISRRLKVQDQFSYRDLPGFLPTSVPGHAGKLLLGHLGELPVCVLSGRAHYYEGHSFDQVTFPIRVLAELGIRDLLLTNAAGGINRRFRPGDFMLLRDHINMMGANPLRGPMRPGTERFVDLSCVYDPGLGRLVRSAARQVALKLHTGTYLAVSGPSYETPAEIRAFAQLGADAVGMSTVPEAIVARQCELTVAAVSYITNAAAGKSKDFLSHADVLAEARRMESQAAAFLEKFATLYAAKR